MDVEKTMFIDKAMIIFVIFLIVSITPISAFEINQTTNTNQTINVIEEDASKLEIKLTELKVHTNKIGGMLGLYNRQLVCILELGNYIRQNR